MTDETENKKEKEKKSNFINEFLTYIPGTKPAKMRLKRAIVKEFQERKKTFAELKNLDNETKQKISSAFRYHAKKNSVTDGTSNYSLELAGRYFVPLFLLLTVCFPFLLAYLFKLNDWVVISFIYILPCMVLSFLILLFVGNVLLPFIRSVWLLAIIAVLLALGSIYLLSQLILKPVQLLIYVITTPIFVVAALALMIVVVFLLLIAGLYMFSERRNKKYAESFIVDEYLYIIELLEKPDFLAKVENRDKVSGLLDEIYKSSKSHLKKTIEIKDPSVASWYNTKFLHIASAVQAIRKAVLFSEQDSLDNVTQRVCKNFLATVSGNLGDCETAEPEKIESHNKLLFFLGSIWNVLKNIIAAVVPMGAFLYLQTTHLKIKDDLAQYVTIFCIGWFAYFIVQIFDPNLPDKLGVIKEAVSNFPGMNKK